MPLEEALLWLTDCSARARSAVDPTILCCSAPEKLISGGGRALLKLASGAEAAHRLLDPDRRTNLTGLPGRLAGRDRRGSTR